MNIVAKNSFESLTQRNMIEFLDTIAALDMKLILRKAF